MECCYNYNMRLKMWPQCGCGRTDGRLTRGVGVSRRTVNYCTTRQNPPELPSAGQEEWNNTLIPSEEPGHPCASKCVEAHQFNHQ